MADRKHGRNKAKCAAYRASGRREANKARRSTRQARRKASIRAQLLQAIDKGHALVQEVVVQLSDGNVAIAESMFVSRDNRVLVVLAKDGDQSPRTVPVSELTFAPPPISGA
jgi:hypothetical protein